MAIKPKLTKGDKMTESSKVKASGIKGTYVLACGAGLGLGYKYQGKVYKSSGNEIVDPERFAEDNGQGYIDSVKGIVII